MIEDAHARVMKGLENMAFKRFQDGQGVDVPGLPSLQ